MRIVKAAGAIGLLLAGSAGALEPGPLHAEIDRLADAVQPRVIEHRRHLHRYPELSNRETQTAGYLAQHLEALGLEVQTGVARTGVIAVLRGGRRGRTVALRADMDALPVVEEAKVPFRSTARTTYLGKEVGVMHACGHDAHMGMLLGVAEILVQLKDHLPGTVKFIFQPAEEGTPPGEEGGAELMVKDGVLKSSPKPGAIFGLHVLTQFESGTLGYRSGSMMASSDDFSVVVRGRQTHGAAPWMGVDPIVTASQIVLGLQTIASRQMDTTRAPVIVTVGKIEGGVRNNIIPDEVRLLGTLRALDDGMRKDLLARVRRTVEDIAHSAGASAEVKIGEETSYPVTVNDPALTAAMLPTLRRVAGAGLFEAQPILGAEDFAFFAREVPGLYLFLGVRPRGASTEEYASNHSPRFKLDESALKLGVRTLSHLALDYLHAPD